MVLQNNMLKIQINKGEPAELDTSDASEVEMQTLQLRAERNNLLALSDSKILPDRGFATSMVTEWNTYRQSLRDMDFSDPENITWPTKPE